MEEGITNTKHEIVNLRGALDFSFPLREEEVALVADVSTWDIFGGNGGESKRKSVKEGTK